MSIEEFASCDPAEYEKTTTEQWLYSTQVDDDGWGNDGVVADQAPTIVAKGRVRAAYNAARIWAGLTWSRDRQLQHNRGLEEDNREYKKAKIEALNKTVGPATGGGGAAARTRDTAAMNEIADVTKRREISVISAVEFRV